MGITYCKTNAHVLLWCHNKVHGLALHILKKSTIQNKLKRNVTANRTENLGKQTEATAARGENHKSRVTWKVKAPEICKERTRTEI